MSKALVVLVLLVMSSGCSAIRLAVPPECIDKPLDQVVDCIEKK
jgi:hypothetical protein